MNSLEAWGAGTQKSLCVFFMALDSPFSGGGMKNLGGKRLIADQAESRRGADQAESRRGRVREKSLRDFFMCVGFAVFWGGYENI